LGDDLGAVVIERCEATLKLDLLGRRQLHLMAIQTGPALATFSGKYFADCNTTAPRAVAEDPARELRANYPQPIYRTM
jgi:hypothetical protein